MRKIIQNITVFIITIVFSIGLLSSLQAQEKQTYVVKAGDTFFSISKKLDVTIAELKQWNNKTDNNLSVGQKLSYYKVDSASSDLNNEDAERLQEEIENEPKDEGESIIKSNSGSSNTFYLVKSGDTLFGIASSNGMTLAELKALNGLTSDNIRVGQRLAIKSTSVAPVVNEFSEESSTQGKFALYTVKRNDNLNAILNKFKMTEAELQALNPDINVQNLALANKITVLLPPSKNFPNPYKTDSGLQDLGTVKVQKYETKNIGKTTTSGELYNPEKLTAAHSNIQLGSIIFVENPANNKGIYVKINDRTSGSNLKLSNKAFKVLGFDAADNPSAIIYTDN